MARMAYVNEKEATERTQDILEKNGSRNIFRMLAHSESHLVNYCRLGNAIRFKGALDAQLRELAITRTGILCHSDYEVAAHRGLGRNVGISEEKLDALDEGANSDVYSDIEKAVLRFTDEVVTSDRPSDATFNAAARTLGPEALVELQISIGFYIMTSKFLRAFDIDLQTG